MNLPTIPFDKSLHVNYGALICAVLIVLLLPVAWLLHVPAMFPLVASFLIAVLIGKLKEVRDGAVAESERLAGLPPTATEDPADFRATAWGALLVFIPSIAVSLM